MVRCKTLHLLAGCHQDNPDQADEYLDQALEICGEMDMVLGLKEEIEECGDGHAGEDHVV